MKPENFALREKIFLKIMASNTTKAQYKNFGG